MESIAGISNNELKREDIKCQLYTKCYPLQRQTLDHDPLATVFLGHLNDGASLYRFILPHRQQSHVQHTHTHTPA